MIIVKCFAGLGNQLFQYACARALQKKYGGEICIDISKFENDIRKFELEHYKLNDKIKIIENNFNSNNKKNYIRRICRKIILKMSEIMPITLFKIGTIFGRNLYLGTQYVKIRRSITNNYLLHGYWQSEEYFKDIKTIIKEEFKLKEKIKESHKKMIKEMQKNNSVCIHIRRGDYVNDGWRENICTEEYYKKGIEIIKKKVKNPIFYIFSDEIEWVKENWRFDVNVKFVDEKNKNYEELNLMSYCKHYIIANSTFSWWAQYLSENDNKIVIAPKRWYNDENKVDIYMKEWITI